MELLFLVEQDDMPDQAEVEEAPLALLSQQANSPPTLELCCTHNIREIRHDTTRARPQRLKLCKGVDLMVPQ